MHVVLWRPDSLSSTQLCSFVAFGYKVSRDSWTPPKKNSKGQSNTKIVKKYIKKSLHELNLIINTLISDMLAMPSVKKGGKYPVHLFLLSLSNKPCCFNQKLKLDPGSILRLT